MVFLLRRLYRTTSIKQLGLRYFCIEATKCKPSATNIPVKTYGQPTSETHPQLLKNGELMPYIQKREFQERRQQLLDLISRLSEKNHHLIIIPSSTKQYMSDKIPYVFRQNTDFLYLSGCLEPDCCLVLAMTDSARPRSVTLFMREQDNHSALWDGPRTTIDDAVGLFGVDQALPISELKNYLACCIKPNTMIWYDYLSPVQKQVQDTMHKFLDDKFKNMCESPASCVHRLRLFKSPAEVELMQRSCDIASDAIAKTITFSQPGASEHQIFAKVDYECRMNGAEYLAYPPVVAGGNRANIIHYINNNQLVQNGELVLMDAGCEYHGYSSDITRTWPIGGKFNLQQAAVYEALLSVQQDLIKNCYDLPSLNQLFNTMCALLGKQLQQIGLVSKSASSDMLLKAAYQFCPHHVSHYLGMDVHDTPTISRSIKLAPGMVITIEPGVYISDKHKVPKEFQGIGVRIEDDILITEDGPIVLTRRCPRTLEEIEKLACESTIET